jgi:hypothetical protein
MLLTRSLIRFLSLAAVIPALTIVLASGPALAQAPLQRQDIAVTQMLDAIQSKSYDEFVARGDEKFKAGFTPKLFEELARQLGPRLKQGYQMSFLTTLNQQGHMVSLWKLSFKDAKDDILLMLFVKNGSIIGFVPQ